MQVQQVMTAHVVSVSTDDTLETVRNLFATHRFHHVVVMENGKIAGIISDRDLLRHMSPFAGKPTERAMDAASVRKKAHQAMTRSVMTIAPQAPAAEAALLLLNNGISCLPVVDDRGACVGIVTSRDMLRWAVGRLTENACVAKLRSDAQKAA